MPCPAEKVWSGKAMQPEATGALRRMGQMSCPSLLLKPASRSLKFNQPTTWLGPNGAGTVAASGGGGASIAQMYICALAGTYP